MQANGECTPIKDRWRHQEPSSGDEAEGAPNFHLRDKPVASTTTISARELADGQARQQTRYSDILCGPLLNYNGMTNAGSEEALWHGSVLIVTASGRPLPDLRLQYKGPWKKEPPSAIHKAKDPTNKVVQSQKPVPHWAFDCTVAGVKLYEEPGKAFWRFTIDLPLQNHEACWVYSIADIPPSNVTFGTVPTLSKGNSSAIRSHEFIVPSVSQSMRIMFHSCNGFSVDTNEDAWSGPALWNDVLRSHAQKPFHVMIGGGDQIYNDSVRVKGPLKAWTEISNPRRRREYPFDPAMRAECDLYYFKNYVEWYSIGQFAIANGQIPQINIWDDHDIIDGFGSYTDHFMECPVFRGLGGVAFKYYCLFQHHVSPPRSTFTTSAAQAIQSQGFDRARADPVQLENSYDRRDQTSHNSFILNSFILGTRPGPYVSECSRSLYMRLGARLAFLGIDARTERTRHQVNYPETYDLIFDRVNAELSNPKLKNAEQSKVTHLVVLLGVPIAYPRLGWLENILTSPIIGPIRFLSKRFGVAGGLFNRFDGQVDLLDDLDDHYTSRHHKHERNILMLRLQDLAETHSVRITILSGDVHLAAVGRFYSNPKHGIPAEQDHRYMANIISSAITNKPPPKAVADLLAKRNKIHHLGNDTDETLMKLFDKDPGISDRTATSCKVTMPSRNYAIISETYDLINSPLSISSITTNGHAVNGDASVSAIATPKKVKAKDGHRPLHPGEEGAGTKHPSAVVVYPGNMKGGLDVCLRVEIDRHDKEGRTEGYGFNIPALKLVR